MSLFPGDKRAAFVGLIGGTVLILATMYAVVLMTNAKFAGHHPPAAEATP